MLHLHRSERADALVVPLAAVLQAPPEDPFALDVVAVPTRGVERWLAQRLSHHLGAGAEDGEGVCANVSFASPARLVAEALAATGVQPEEDPWEPDRLAWHLLEVLDACSGESWCSALGRHLGAAADEDDLRRGRRFRTAQHLAALFASYGAQRPPMLRAWAEHDDEDGTGAPVPEDLAWQPELWRRLRGRLGMPSPAERLPDAVGRLLRDPGAVDLPQRLSVFGPTRLPEAQLQVLAALARHRDVHLWLPHPSPALWATAATAPPVQHRRRRDTPTPAAHPLLASMARDATELQLRLADAEPHATTRHHPAAETPATLLGALQRRLRDDDAESAPAELDPADRSVQIHACHGRARQVEVLREALIGLIQDDPTLEPRDVVVMCPDIEAVAPLVSATFGVAAEDGADVGGDTHPGRSLRVRLADRSLRQTNPLLSLLSRLLEMADGRVTASEVVDLLSLQPVRRRFRLDDEDVDRIRGWAVDAGVRWGEDASRRERFGLGHVRQGTWETALDRILLGVAMAEEDQRYVFSALPLDDVGSTDVDLAGRLAELVDRLTDLLRRLTGTRAAGDWLDTLDAALDVLGDTTAADEWQDVQARAVLDDVRRAAGSGPGVALRLEDVRALLGRRLQGRPTRAGFRTGALTMCSLEPMRAVPHRVVVLLGMDDGAFPRRTRADGDDLLLREPLVGERDRRGEDRQLFLDAVGAAGQHLLVLYSGADERTGAPRPPAVPVSELLDALDATARAADGRLVRDHVVVRHPLQTVDERNFTAGVLHRAGPFSFDRVAHRAATAGRGVRTTRVPFLDAPLPLPAEAAGAVDLAELVADLERPVRAFVRRRLGVTLPGEVAELEDALPLHLDPLEQWQVGDRLLAAALDGVDLEQAVQAEARRGLVPPRRLGGAVLDDVRARVAPIAETVQPHRGAPATTVDLTVRLPSGRSVNGTVLGVHDGVLVRAVYSKLAAKHRLRAWVQLLALTAAEPDARHTALTVGRSRATAARASLARIGPPHPEDALRWLDQLVALRDGALREPLPLPLAAGCAYARSRAAEETQEQALESAGREFTGAYEHLDADHRLVWGDDVTFEDVLATRPSVEETRWWPEEHTRFGVLARRLWEPLLQHEHTETV